MQNPNLLYANVALKSLMVSLFGESAASAYVELSTFHNRVTVRSEDSSIRKIITRRAVRHRLSGSKLTDARATFTMMVNCAIKTDSQRDVLNAHMTRLQVHIEQYRTLRKDHPEKRSQIRMMCYMLSFDFQEMIAVLAAVIV